MQFTATAVMAMAAMESTPQRSPFHWATILGTPLNAKAKEHVVIFGTQAKGLVNLRGPLMRAFAEDGHRISAIAEPAPESVIAPLLQMGVAYYPLDIERAGLNPMKDLGAIIGLYRILTKLKPDVFFGYSIKPVIYGMSVARAAGIPRRVGMMPGLGYAFTDGEGRWLVRTIASLLLRAGVAQSDLMIFQNPDDRQTLIDSGVVRDNERTALVNGSGVELDRFAPVPLPNGPVTFLMIARLLKDKGLYEYISAARQVKAARPNTRFLLVGELDPNPAGITKVVLDQWIAEGVVEYLGELPDVRTAIAQAHVYVLPSYYREGTPRTVLEAMAMRRPVITTNSPGCRETIVDGESGFLVPPRADAILAERMKMFVDSPDLIERMAEASLTRVKAKFEAMAVGRATAALILGTGTR